MATCKFTCLRPPQLNSGVASALITTFFPFKHVALESLKPLPSYDDRNVYFEGVREHNSSDQEEPFVLKVWNRGKAFSTEVIQGLSAIQLRLKSNRFPCTWPVAARSGHHIHFATLNDWGAEPPATGVKYLVQVFSYVPGQMMDNIEKKYFTPELAYRVGYFIGSIDCALQDFHHAAIEERVLGAWDLQHFLNIKKYIPHIRDEQKKKMANVIVGTYETHVLPALPSLKKGVIHGDVNGLNIVLRKDGLEYDTAGLIDFGDCIHSCYLFELAIMTAYGMVEKDHSVQFVAPMVRGYLKAFPLAQEEVKYLYYAVLARLCQSMVMGEYRFTQEPWNTYLLTTPAEAWKLINLLLTLTKERVDEIWGVS